MIQKQYIGRITDVEMGVTGDRHAWCKKTSFGRVYLSQACEYKDRLRLLLCHIG